MNNQVKAALIIGGSILVAIGLWIYFSPYQTCVRAEYDRGSDRAEIRCAAVVSGRR